MSEFEDRVQAASSRQADRARQEESKTRSVADEVERERARCTEMRPRVQEAVDAVRELPHRLPLKTMSATEAQNASKHIETLESKEKGFKGWAIYRQVAHVEHRRTFRRSEIVEVFEGWHFHISLSQGNFATMLITPAAVDLKVSLPPFSYAGHTEQGFTLDEALCAGQIRWDAGTFKDDSWPASQVNFADLLERFIQVAAELVADQRVG